jgi:Uma2 family endonuclease
VAPAAPSVPPLQSGDHLSREEFHRRYLEYPHLRAELVEGVVYVSSPVSAQHGEPHLGASGWLYVYRTHTSGVSAATDTTVFLPGDNEVQPDVCLYRLPPLGRVRYVSLKEGDETVTYLDGAPELVVEIAASSASYDLHSKKRVYERAGVEEYIAWLIFERRIVWFRLVDGRFVEVEPDASGVIESATFPGLRLDVGAMLAGDDAAVVAELERGLFLRDAAAS